MERLIMDPEGIIIDTSKFMMDVILDYTQLLSKEYDIKAIDVKEKIIEQYNYLYKKNINENILTLSIYQAYLYLLCLKNEKSKKKIEGLIWEIPNILLNKEIKVNKEKEKTIKKIKEYDEIIVYTTGNEDLIRKWLKDIEINKNIKFDINVCEEKDEKILNFILKDKKRKNTIDPQIDFDFNKELNTFNERKDLKWL